MPTTPLADPAKCRQRSSRVAPRLSVVALLTAASTTGCAHFGGNTTSQGTLAVNSAVIHNPDIPARANKTPEPTGDQSSTAIRAVNPAVIRRYDQGGGRNPAPELTIEFGSPTPGAEPILVVDTLSLDHKHRTAVVLVDHDDKITLRVKETTKLANKLTLDGVFLDATPLSTVNETCTPGQPCTATLDLDPGSVAKQLQITCGDPVRRVAFHVRTQHGNGSAPQVFIRDPLVIIVPKKCDPPT